MTFNVFVRNWWKENPSYPNGLEPHPGKKRFLAKDVEKEETARLICRDYNRTHDPGRLSKKAEYEEI